MLIVERRKCWLILRHRSCAYGCRFVSLAKVSPFLTVLSMSFSGLGGKTRLVLKISSNSGGSGHEPKRKGDRRRVGELSAPFYLSTPANSLRAFSYLAWVPAVTRWDGGVECSSQLTASTVARTMPSPSRLSRVAAIDPSTSMPLHASSTTTTAKPSLCASSAE